MKRILLLTNKDTTLLYFRQELINKLVKDGNELYVSFPKSDKVKYFEEDLKCRYVEVEMDRHGINPFNDFKILKRYLKTIKEIKPDVVLTFTIKPNIYGGIACRIMKVPYIANITGLGTGIENGGIVKKIAVKLYKIAFKRIQCCFVQNTENMAFVKENKFTKDDKIRLIPGSGVNLEKYSVLPYPTEENTVDFLFIGRIMKEKGIEEYLTMAKHITNKYKNTRFHILGFCEQDYEERLKKAEQEGIITYHGRQDNIIPYMNISSCTIHPSYYPEGMSNVLLETAASGRPAITTDRSGCRETVDDEITGFIIKQKDSNDLISKVEKFLSLSNENRKNMGLKARAKVETEFDRNIVVNAYIEEIEKI